MRGNSSVVIVELGDLFGVFLPVMGFHLSQWRLLVFVRRRLQLVTVYIEVTCSLNMPFILRRKTS